MSTLGRHRTDTVLAWKQDVVFTQQLRTLHALFALPAPWGSGLYHHHNGLQR